MVDDHDSVEPLTMFLDDLAHRSFRWLATNCHPSSGMVLDRAANLTWAERPSRMSSIASTGYYLSLLPYAVDRGWITDGHARSVAEQAMRFVLEQVPQHRGLLHHFVDWETGQRWSHSEFSLLDTAIFLNGCIVASEAFDELTHLANIMLDRVEWPYYLTPHPVTGQPLLSFGWTPDAGGKLLSPADVRSSELAMPYFLAVGSRTHPIDPQIWYNTAVVWGEVCGHRLLNPTHALFTSYYGLGWMDLRGLEDRDGIDLNSNARAAALANREYCRSVGSRSFATYQTQTGGWWGLSAGDSPGGYVARGPVGGDPDGTVWPMTALAAVPWIPDIVYEDLPLWQSSDAWPDVCGTYGISPFSLDRRWIWPELIGIDVGSYALSWSNHRDGAVWALWMRHPTALRALERLQYRPAPPKAAKP